MSNLIIRIFGGFGVGALLTLLTLIFALDSSAEVVVRDITLNLLGSMIAGAYFSVAALIFNLEHWSMLKQTVIHYSTSLLVLFPVFTFLTGWIPLKPIALVVGVGIFTGTYLLNWLGWYMYFKQLEKRMNDSVQKRN